MSKSEFLDGVQALAALEADASCPHNRLYLLGGMFARELDFATMNGALDARRNATFAAPVRSAVVATTPAAVNVARLVTAMNTNEQISIQTFRAREDAEAWLTS
ncbi:MAG: hypothetical protein IT357_18995 [Gemmatimonadaceae bacterium]|nr:hypothetical protein [Gemmatimonadaceae bacterium]